MMHETIVARLHEVCAACGVRPLLAVEAGSRAWGFESPDSDYDVRFIYSRPAYEYLCIRRPRDVIEAPDFMVLAIDADLDISGWDLPKALGLASKSNPALLEWLYGPITYFEDCAFTSELRRIMANFSPHALVHHYSSMARHQHQAYIKNAGERVVYKKYLYALRPIFCVLWMQRNPGLLPPVAFAELWRDVEGMEPAAAELHDFVDDLLTRKARTTEKEALPRYAAIEAFIDAHMQPAEWDIEPRQPDAEALDELCRRTLLNHH